MSRTLGILLSGLLLGAGGDDGGNQPSHWKHNPRGRTEAGLELQSEGEPRAADRAFGEALELDPADPLVRFNAGTASLLAGGEGADQQAVELLRSAAELAPPGLRPLAHYNLGNAQLAGGALPEAIESYKESLRLEPGSLDAKHNLELALRLLDEQQEQEEEDQNQQQEQQQSSEQSQSPEQNEPREDEQEGDEQQQQPRPEDGEEPQQPEPDQDRPLPDFEDQPDMTAEQAAAILEAVENLEREQRRKQAMEQLKRAKGDRDW